LCFLEGKRAGSEPQAETRELEGEDKEIRALRTFFIACFLIKARIARSCDTTGLEAVAFTNWNSNVC